jgi:NADH:ubiquinone oxidoreductase subunit B-like Fe-S oxidoreductase
VLSTLDKVVNWARQGSMWPMTFGARYVLAVYSTVLMFFSVMQDWLAVPWK